MRKNILWMMLGSLITIVLIAGLTFFTSYKRNIGEMKATTVEYKQERITTYLSADACDYLIDGQRSLYLGKLPSEEHMIEINSPNRATLYVYPFDENAILIHYEPRNGIARTYKKSGYGDFNCVLKTLYELTDNKAFDEIIDYDNLNK